MRSECCDSSMNLLATLDLLPLFFSLVLIPVSALGAVSGLVFVFSTFWLVLVSIPSSMELAKPESLVWSRSPSDSSALVKGLGVPPGMSPSEALRAAFRRFCSAFFWFVFLSKDRGVGSVHLSQDHFVEPDRLFTAHRIAAHLSAFILLLYDGPWWISAGTSWWWHHS